MKTNVPFLDDLHTVEALNEPVDDSGSEGGLSEMEYSPWYGYYNKLTIPIVVFKCMSEMLGFLNPTKH